MKKVVSLILAMILLLCSVTVVGAFSPVAPEEHAVTSFYEIYSETTNEEVPHDMIALGKYDSYTDAVEPWYVLIKYTSPDPIQEPYFSRFGVNDEYYEYREVTNLMYGSGITVFYGDAYYPYDEEETFYSLDELTEIEPTVVEWVFDFLGPDYVGKIGDADKDGEISVMDATAILRHEAKLETMEVELIGDIDGDGELSVLDATAVQQSLVN